MARSSCRSILHVARGKIMVTIIQTLRGKATRGHLAEPIFCCFAEIVPSKFSPGSYYQRRFKLEKKEKDDMRSRFLTVLGTLGLVGISVAAAVQDPMVGGAAMYPTKNIVQNAMNSADHTTLVAAVKAAGLVDTLEGPGPFTVFAPTNEAFAKLPPGTVDTLVKPENKEMLMKILTYHVVAGRLSTADIQKMIKAGNGKAELKTVGGGTLTATNEGGKVMLQDEKGGMATITISNVYQSNGVIQVIDTVLMPN
jgi:uncharacterized surface protein with fasciclin (FAS1) repeats